MAKKITTKEQIDTVVYKLDTHEISGILALALGIDNKDAFRVEFDIGVDDVVHGVDVIVSKSTTSKFDNNISDIVKYSTFVIKQGPREE